MRATMVGLRALSVARKERTSPSAAPPRLWRGLCLMFTRTTLGVAAKHPSAIEAWRSTPKEQRHADDDPPPGVPVYWSGGKYGHVALSAGAGYIWSTDIKRVGKVDKVRLSLVEQRWGLQYLGWTESINGVRVYPPTPTVVRWADVLERVKARGDYTGPVGMALKAEGCSPDVKGYARWQRRLGYRGRDADGFAGLRSLRELGRRHGFEVRQ